MGNYIQIEFQNISPSQSEILVAELSQINFEGFEENENSLRAFVNEKDFDEAALNEITTHQNLNFLKSNIEETNWNQVWESNFQPVSIEDFVTIRAAFHEPVKNTEHEIIITPKMSFGTGHHATTFMMIKQMREIDFKDKSVFDFGTGTGILSILAEKLGAGKILATDNDDWSIDNAAENFANNNCGKIILEKKSIPPQESKFDIILANISKSVILENFGSLFSQLNPNGILLISGLLIPDKKELLCESEKYFLKFEKELTLDNWISMRFAFKLH